ncbi:MAG: VWA domain-containing protein [Microscillaceae bacterium]|nr:VWA domain-containing protein [Microscillaceae bacterium]MDW8461945.1 vWA domain-containing protein [Cytophagales bacterium]
MQGLKYTVDIVMCIDTTGSMSPIIGKVKENALKFYEDLDAVMQAKGKAIDTLRVKVIAFKDYYYDGNDAMRVSDFFVLPSQREQFQAFVDSLRAEGGGDEPENGLEAIFLAIHSDWNTTGDKKRQIIVVWTDASTHELEKNEGRKPANYPANMPKNFDELSDHWDGQFMSRSSKRLIVYAPDAYAWTDIANHWENTIQYPSKAGEGLSEVDYQTILDAIASSV